MATSSYRSGFDVAWLPGHMVRFDLDTGVADTVASYDMAPFAPREGPKNPFPPFGDVSVAGGQFVHGRSDVPQLTWRTPDGETRQIVRWSPDRTYPTADNWAAFESFLQTELPRVNPQLSGADLEQMVQRSLAEYELVGDEPLPIYTTLAGDDEGRVWLGEFSIHSRLNGIPRYTIFASDGGWLGTLEVPARFRVLDVAGGLVLGVVQDEIDVESVVVYELLLTELEG